jgi:hypothetical protein
MLRQSTPPSTDLTDHTNLPTHAEIDALAHAMRGQTGTGFCSAGGDGFEKVGEIGATCPHAVYDPVSRTLVARGQRAASRACTRGVPTLSRLAVVRGAAR